MSINVSKECTAFFRVEESHVSKHQAVAYFSNVNIEELISFELSINFYSTVIRI
jgi:hypothetical protein